MGALAMGLAVLVFSLVVGFFHYQGPEPVLDESEMLAAEPQVPASYESVDHLSDSAVPQPAAAADPALASELVVDGAPQSGQDLAQRVADRVAADPAKAASVVSAALLLSDDESTLGDVATIAAAATRAAPGEAPAIAGAVTRALKDKGDAVLAAAVATIVSLVPEQSRDIGLVVGAIVGDDVEALGMVAQTVAIATGEATFASLSEASGVSVTSLMRASSEFGSSVPFDVPAYAAQLAPSPSQVAEGTSAGTPADAR